LYVLFLVYYFLFLLLFFGLLNFPCQT